MTHPLSDFCFCPRCGSSKFAPHNANGSRCADCGFEFYPNAAAATVAVIVSEAGELLCIRRDREPAKGTLDLPGGFVDPGESLTDGLLREVREEVGGEVTDYRFLFSIANVYPYSGHLVYTADAFFRCRLRDTTRLRASDDAAAMCWIPLAKLRPADFGLDSIRKGVERIIASGL